MAGRKDVLMEQEESREQKSASETSAAGSNVPDRAQLEEPGVYMLDRVPEQEKQSDLNEPLNANYGRRWIDFQQKLREGRDKVVGGCPLCGTQDKAA